MKSRFVPAFFSLLFFLSLTDRPADRLQDDVLKYTNEFRNSQHLPNLEMNVEMNKIAQKHSQDMADGKLGLGHDGFVQRTELIKKKLKFYGAFAENVAFGVRTGKDAVELWENSEGHRKNMLGDYKHIGIGIATSKKGEIYFTQIFSE